MALVLTILYRITHSYIVVLVRQSRVKPMIRQGTLKNFVKTHEFGTNPLHTLVSVMNTVNPLHTLVSVMKSITHTSECNEI